MAKLTLYPAKRRERGFTLIELLTVIAIIGILSAVTMVGFDSSRKRARDSRRITDIDQIALALEMYYNRCRGYPAKPLSASSQNGSYGNTSCQSSAPGIPVTFGNFISQTLPTDPGGGAYEYEVSADGKTYVVGATLELANSATNSDADGTPLSVNCEDTPTIKYCRSE